MKSNSDNKIFIFKNRDKEGWYESWTNGRNLLNFPHPFRCIVSGNPGSGKTNMIFNIICKSKPKFKKIYLCHFDQNTKEYTDLSTINLPELPDSRSSNFKPKIKSLLIIDDYDFAALSKPQMNNLRSLFKYASTHKGLSIIVATQDFFNLPPIIRRSSNIFFIWKGSSDLDSLFQIGRRLGYTKNDFKVLLDTLRSRFDNLCIDLTVDSPAPVRLNGYTLLKSESRSLKSEFMKQKEEEEKNDSTE